MSIRNALTSVVIFSLLLAVVSCSRNADEYSGATPNPDLISEEKIAVEGMTVSSSRLVTEIRGAGVVEGVREAWVVSETEGLVRDISFNLGDRVEQGHVLLSVDAELARRNRDLAEQQNRTARLEYEAAVKAKDNGSMSMLQYSQVTDRLLSAEASLAAAADAYENTMLKSPFRGVVAIRDGSIGIGTLLTRGVRVARIVDDSSFRTEIGVGEGQVLLVQEGARALIMGKDGISRTGRVRAISAGSDSGTGTYAVIVEWNPASDDRLRSGMSVNVSVEIEGDDKRVIVPASAIRLRGGREYVFVAVNEIAEAREIITGSRLGERVEVLEGLRDGETIITSGLSSVTPGSSVNVSIIGMSGDA